MKSDIDFYFDFISPYGYLAAMKIESIGLQHRRRINWQPFLLGITVLKTMGLKPLMETPLKGDYCRYDIPRLAKILNVPINLNTNMNPNPLPAIRSAYWVKQHAPQLISTFCREVMMAQWQQGQDISHVEVIEKILKNLNINTDSYLADIQSDTLKQNVVKEVEQTMKVGVFGSPTFVVDGEMIWGVDRLWMLEHWLRHESWHHDDSKLMPVD